jgi:hypothetical protein
MHMVCSCLQLVFVNADCRRAISLYLYLILFGDIPNEGGSKKKGSEMIILHNMNILCVHDTSSGISNMLPDNYHIASNANGDGITLISWLTGLTIWHRFPHWYHDVAIQSEIFAKKPHPKIFCQTNNFI